MKGFAKRLGWFGLAVVALIACIVGQILLGALAMIPAMIVEMGKLAGQGITDFYTLYENSYSAMMDAAPMGVLLYHILSIPLFGLWLYFGCGRNKPQKLGKVFTAKRVISTVIFSLGLCFAANAFVLFAPYIAPKAMAQYEFLMEAAGMGVDWMTILASVLLAPIGEEILCRGIIFHYAKKATAGINPKVGFWIANVIQAIMFGIMHFNWIQGSYAFLLGLGIGWLAHKYKSLYPAMLAHFVVNVSSTFLMGFLLMPIPDSILGYSIVAVISIILLVVGVFIGKEAKE